MPSKYSQKELKELLKLKLLDKVDSVNLELNRDLDSKSVILDTCPSRFVKIAQKLIKLEEENIFFTRQDLTKKEAQAIKDYASSRNIPFKQVFDIMISNPRYLNHDAVNARHIVNLLEEFDYIYDKYYQEYKAFPMNLLSQDARSYLKHQLQGYNMPLVDKLEVFIEVFRPDIKNFKVDSYNHEILPQSRKQLTKNDVNRINEQLAKFVVDNNLDSLFLKENEEYFKSLCRELKLNGLTFDKYVKKYTTYSYTPVFKLDVVKAVKQMVTSYYNNNGTTLGITRNDPYLRSKIEAAQEVLNIHSTKELFTKLGLENDNFINREVLNKNDFDKREDQLIKELEKISNNHVLPETIDGHHDLYYSALDLAHRKDFKDINDYLESIGFYRSNRKANPKERVIYLSKNDLLHYDFVSPFDNKDKIIEKFIKHGITYLDPYEYLGNYRKLVAEKIDCRKYVKTNKIDSKIKL